MDSKGLSPLTSTILLLILSIVIGIIVMTWGKSYVESAAIDKAYSAEPAKTTSILQELDARLQKGEITKEQYDKIKAVIVKNS